MNIFWNRFQIHTQLDDQLSSEKMENLLSQESVTFEKNGNTIRSTETPFVILNWDRRLNSRNNWVGVNPFAYITSIQITFNRNDDGKRYLSIVINKFRTHGFYLMVLGLTILIAFSVLKPIWALVVSLILAVLVFFLLFTWLTGTVLEEEIKNALE